MSRYSQRKKLYDKQDGICAYCFNQMTFENNRKNTVTRDHVVPVSRGAGAFDGSDNGLGKRHTDRCRCNGFGFCSLFSPLFRVGGHARAGQRDWRKLTGRLGLQAFSARLKSKKPPVRAALGMKKFLIIYQDVR